MATGGRRDTRPRRFRRDGAAGQERPSGHPDGRVHAAVRVRHGTESRWGLQYVQIGPDHWWDGDDNSPTFNTMQVCKKEQCAFNTAESENLQIPQYKHAVVMGVNTARTPGDGAAFFFHTTDGGPTAGCVAIDDAKLVQIIQWLRPGPSWPSRNSAPAAVLTPQRSRWLARYRRIATPWSGSGSGWRS